MSVKVYKKTEVYAILELSNGKKYTYFPDGGKVDSIINTMSSYDLKGKGVVKAYDENNKMTGASLQALVTVTPIVYGNADSSILAISPYTYELAE